ncbi:mitochondrial ribonuclease P catalytic subunit-like [Amphibalanus amphitrite]|uniref:mitochondrial ribonuclease P catalytic subunit-like n=1 Tax=Amphibalanus amphitrite TaxID=1232801 RepID=UPI001C91DDB9|nr:mitochondrial ribonuclease P catalytic subunit-like [Amphibalanus amphitrite]XP_043227100.1 mitochondrial ribonuclease P catalytic subunit-like [Amphibalanus amphitrite]
MSLHAMRLLTAGTRFLVGPARPTQLSHLLSSVAGPSARSRQKERRDTRRELQERAEQLLLATASAARPPSGADWERAVAEYRRLVPSASPHAVDHRALAACRLPDGGVALPAAISLLRHRQEQGTVPPANLALFLELLASCDAAARDAAEPETLAAHAALSAAPLDRVSATRAAVGLCATRHWRLAVPLLTVARRSGPPPRTALSALAAAALRAGEDALGWEVLEELSALRLRPTDDALDTWLERCETRARAEARLELRGDRPGERRTEVGPAAESAEQMVLRLLEFLSDSGVILSEGQVVRLRDLCTQRLARPWVGEATQVSSRGRCEHCGLHLPPDRLSVADFREVRDALERRVLIGEDVFQTSTPEEVERFRSFVERTAPYDVVVDGLNVGLATAGVRGGAPLSAALVQVVDHFAVQQGKKVLVVGRYHMRGWKKADMGYVKRHALLFTADNMSSDDAFLLYAVMHSHPGTQFVTRDFFRDHAARLPDETRSKFNRLIRTNRLAVEGVTRNGNLNIKMPIVHSVQAQCDPAGRWHVPFCDPAQVSFSTATPSPTQPVTDRWLCLQPPPPHR